VGEAQFRKLKVQASPSIKHISKITNTRRAGRLAEVVECMPGKCKALSSTPSPAKIDRYINKNLKIQ
jgi:hypothetical protein